MFKVYDTSNGGSTLIESDYYEDSKHKPFSIEYSPGKSFRILVSYKWYSSPAPDYTVKVYSKMSLDVKEMDSNMPNVLYTTEN